MMPAPLDLSQDLAKAAMLRRSSPIGKIATTMPSHTAAAPAANCAYGLMRATAPLLRLRLRRPPALCSRAMQDTAAALSLQGVACTFASRDDADQRYTAVKDVTLTVGAGEFVAVVGPTGCGKSTLLNVAAGLLAPSAGVVNVFGTPLQGVNTRAGYMFQADSLMPWRTAQQNVMAGLEFRGVALADARAQTDEWLKRVGLGGFGDRYPHQLSGGMKKRTSLAQTLALDPDIILMDEPFSALDIQTRQLMENEVLALWAAKKKAVLFITHDLDEAIAMSDRVVVMSAGPASRPIGEFAVDLARPRDVAEIKTSPRFVELHAAIWAVLRDEVLKGYTQQLQAKAA
jgi:NitT/TauT family transport system ATP-binding protein